MSLYLYQGSRRSAHSVGGERRRVIKPIKNGHAEKSSHSNNSKATARAELAKHALFSENLHAERTLSAS